MTASAFRHERANVFILVLAQTLYMVASVTVLTLSGVVGTQLAPNLSLATLPVSLMMVGSVLSTLPASLFMRVVGRRLGFITGAAVGGVGGGLLCAWGISQLDFWLFCGGSLLLGLYQGFAMYYRFAAVDVAEPKNRSKAISWVMTGGVFAAFLGPWNASALQDIWPQYPNAGPYWVIALMTLLAIALLSQLRVPAVMAAVASVAARPMPVIARQPAFVVAVLTSAISYAVMALVMTATPLAMRANGFEMVHIAMIMQWHVLGMFVPSFVTGRLISRFGMPKVSGVGVLLLLCASGVALLGQTLNHYWVALVLLGVGWNFCFIGGSALLASVHSPSERAKVQGLNDLLVFALVAVGSLLAGALFYRLGWAGLNLAMLPLVAGVGVALAILRRRGQDVY